MTAGSLFAGIGGFDLGFERAGFDIRWQVEIDDYANRVLAKHWPHVTRYRDIRTIDWSAVEPVDVVCGGFPCQPHSVAGRRKASEDDRDLWPEVVRCLREVKPRWFVGENVTGLLSSESGRFFGTVLRDLAACGFDVEWDCLPASAFGAPHRRDRVWIVAHSAGRGGERRRAGRREACGGGAFDVPPRSGARPEDVADAASGIRQRQTPRQAGHAAFRREDVAHADSERGCGGQAWSAYAADAWESSRHSWRGQWHPESDVCRVVNGLPHRAHRLRGLGNAVVPQIPEWIARRILHAECSGVSEERGQGPR